MEQYIRIALKASAAVKLATAEKYSGTISKMADQLITAYKNGGKLLVCGNGGSAADAQHIAAELVGKFKMERRALPALALTTNSSIITAIANDYDFDSVFSRQVEAWGEKGDVLLAISTSGRSKNILQAVSRAKEKGLIVLALTGKDGGLLKGAGDVTLVVPSDDTQHIQETHIAVGHILCELVEQALFRK